jgi:hypothetical protein
MTGSGKTGLGVALLEEAAIDGIPALIIDPKGDLTNLALQFPRLSAEEFRPWISEEAAGRAGVSSDAFARQEAEAWEAGLQRWGQDRSRIRRLQESADVVVFTPGSSAGVPISVIRSFSPPSDDVMADPELLASELETPVASLLGLLGINTDASRGREATLLSCLLREAWTRGESLSLTDLAGQIQKPPMSRIGVLEMDAFYPEKDRFQLVLALNNLIASPGFEIWRQGVPLDIDALLHTPAGKPRLAVFSIAHLSDSERMFFVSMLLGATLAWMRKQRGTTSLRALLYMDEIFGYFPPTANPPSKKPLMTLMKQARAFGLGVVLATQNPADLDYKGLSNAGTWFIGRLQAERDKQRLLDGLSGMGVDRAKIDRLLSGLGKRVFLMNNVHETEPVLFESRWALSYLCGPLTREQIRTLPKPAISSAAPSHASKSSQEVIATPVDSTSRPPTVDKVRQIFTKDADGAVLAPMVVGRATVRFRNTKVDSTQELTLLAEISDELTGIEWGRSESADLASFQSAPPDGTTWLPLPEVAWKSRSYDDWKRGLAAWLVQDYAVRVFTCEGTDLVSTPGEGEGPFRVRVRQALHEVRDARLTSLREKFAKKAGVLENRLRSAQEALRVQDAQAGQARVNTALTIGQTLLGAFLGRKRLGAATLSRAGTAALGVGRAVKESDDVASAKARVQAIEEEIGTLNRELAEEVCQISESLDPDSCPLQEVQLTVSKAQVQWVGLAWIRVG